MSILVPRRLVPQPQCAVGSPLLGFFLTYELVTGQKVAISELARQLTCLRRSDVVRLITWIAPIVTARKGYDPGTQVWLADQLFDDSLRSQLQRCIEENAGQPWIIFHRQQLWFLLQMAVICCSEDTAASTEEKLKCSLGYCCLIANAHLGPKELPARRTREEEEQWVATMMLPLGEINAGSDWRGVLARAQHFWLDLPSEAAVSQKAVEIGIDADFDAIFQAEYGVSLRKFIGILTISYAFFLKQGETGPRLLNLDEYFAESTVHRDAEAVFRLISQKPEDLAFVLMNEPRQSWSLDFTPLRRRPVLEVFRGRYACPDRSLLYRVFTDGVYWLLKSAVNRQGGSGFSQLFGHIFEAYINKLINRFAYSGTELARTFYMAPKFQGTNDEVCDGLLHWTSYAILMEYKSGLLTTRQKYACDKDATFDGIHMLLARDGKGVRKGVAQLAESLRRMLSGDQIAVGGTGDQMPLDLSRSRIIPAIIVYEECLGLHAVRNYADQKFRRALEDRGVPPHSVAPLLILTVADVEQIEALTGIVSAEDIIRKYVDAISATDSLGSFHSHVYNTYSRTTNRERSFVEETAEALFERIIADLEGEEFE